MAAPALEESAAAHSAYHAENVLYLAPEARFDYLLTLPESADIWRPGRAQAVWTRAE